MCVGGGGGGQLRGRGSGVLSIRRVFCQTVTRIFTTPISGKELGRQDDSKPFPPPLSPWPSRTSDFYKTSLKKQAEWNPGEACGLLGGSGWGCGVLRAAAWPARAPLSRKVRMAPCSLRVFCRDGLPPAEYGLGWVLRTHRPAARSPTPRVTDHPRPPSPTHTPPPPPPPVPWPGQARPSPTPHLSPFCPR